MPRKDNPFTDNPFGRFDEPSEDPFQDSTVAPAEPGAWTGSKGKAWENSPATIPLTNGVSSSSTGIQMDVMKRQEQLDLKEKELIAREEDLKRQKDKLIADGVLKPKKNWPKCYPITYHDIKGEVPGDNQRMVTYCYWAFLGFFVAVTFNWFGSLMALCVINPGSGRVAGFLLATIYWFAGLPGAWILWYIRIYNVAIKDRALVYAWFFIMFLVHIAFCIWACISPPLPFINDWSHAGFVTSIKAFDKDTFVGVVFIIGGVIWALESLWSLWALKTVYMRFRQGSGVRRMKQEAAGEVAKRAMKPNFGAGDV